jgi:hypothetical protein
MATAPVQEVQVQIEALHAFNRGYEAYLERGYGGLAKLRRGVIRAVPGTQEAVNRVGRDPR